MLISIKHSIDIFVEHTCIKCDHKETIRMTEQKEEYYCSNCNARYKLKIYAKSEYKTCDREDWSIKQEKKSRTVWNEKIFRIRREEELREKYPTYISVIPYIIESEVIEERYIEEVGVEKFLEKKHSSNICRYCMANRLHKKIKKPGDRASHDYNQYRDSLNPKNFLMDKIIHYLAL